MDKNSSNTTIDQKMAKMRLKNLELLKRHQEIEKDRQLAVQLGATTTIENMRGTKKNRIRPNIQIDNSYERTQRLPTRRKFENDRNDTQPQRAQRIDYNRLKREHAQEKQITNSKNPDLHDYTFHYQSENTNNDFDEPTHAKKLVIVNNKVDRIGSGRFNQQQRTQEKGQRKREERMHRSTVQTNGQIGGTNEFHLDIPPMPMWQNGPMHVQLIPHHTGIDHLINTSGEQIDQTSYIHNFVYSPSTAQPTAFNSNGTVYFAQTPSSQTHFHQYHSPRTFENSTHPQFHLSPIFQPPPPPQPVPSEDLSPRFHRLKTPEYENKQRPMSGDFERLHNSHQLSSSRFQIRPQSFYDFSSNNNSFRSTTNNNNNNNNNNRLQRNNNTSLPLSAYINVDNKSNQNENLNNHWGTNYQKRRSTQQRTYHQDKHQFPLSSYDISQYTFNNNSNRRRINNNNHNNDIDLIEEWWEDNETELIGTNPSASNTNSKTTTTTTIIDDSGNSSLSNSMNLKETTLDDLTNPPSDVSTTDSNIIESLDKLQQQLKLEEAVDERLASNELNKELTTYDTAHFMQWAKEKFREELAGRLTAQEIEQHDAVTTDDDDIRKNNLEKMDAFEDDFNEKLTIDEKSININCC